MRVVGHLLAERGVDDVVSSQLDERERLDRPVLDGSRAELAGKLYAEVARLDASFELSAPEVVPHEPEVVLLEPHRVVHGFQPLSEVLRPLGRFRTEDETQRRRLRLDREPLVSELVGQTTRLLDVRPRDRVVVGPVVGEPGGREERLDHCPLVAHRGRERVRLLVGCPCDRRVLLLVERADVVRAGEGEQRVELGHPIAAGAHGLEHVREVCGRGRPVEQVEV